MQYARLHFMGNAIRVCSIDVEPNIVRELSIEVGYSRNWPNEVIELCDYHYGKGGWRMRTGHGVLSERLRTLVLVPALAGYNSDPNEVYQPHIGRNGIGMVRRQTTYTGSRRFAYMPVTRYSAEPWPDVVRDLDRVAGYSWTVLEPVVIGQYILAIFAGENVLEKPTKGVDTQCTTG